jgi:hypothetical protein
MGRFHIARYPVVSLFRGFTDELSVPHEFVPVEFASFKNGHCFSFPLFILIELPFWRVCDDYVSPTPGEHNTECSTYAYAWFELQMELSSLFGSTLEILFRAGNPTSHLFQERPCRMNHCGQNMGMFHGRRTSAVGVDFLRTKHLGHHANP